MRNIVKSSIALLLAICMISTLFIATAFADAEVTIPANKTSKGGIYLKKESASAEPSLELYEISPRASIKFWIWRKSTQSVVSKTYEFNSYGSKSIQYKSGNKQKGDYYHDVWKRTTQPLSNSVYIGFSFIP